MVDVDFTEDRCFSLGWGLIFRAVCAPKSWDAERVSNDATRENPPGTSLNRWEISEPDSDRDDAFKGANPIQCPDCEDRWHWLLNC